MFMIILWNINLSNISTAGIPREVPLDFLILSTPIILNQAYFNEHWVISEFSRESWPENGTI